MKKTFTLILIIAMMIPAMAQVKITNAPESKAAKEIKLVKPTRKGGMPLYEALNKRKTNRTFAEKPLTDQQLSDLLWCANGVNREDGRRTAPTARNSQQIDVYVFLPQGVYFYNYKEHKLDLVLDGDHRPQISPRSDMPVKAPVTLLFVANYEKMEGFDESAREFYGATDAGFVSQNVYLYCAANNLNTVVMGAIDREPLRDLLQVKGKVILGQPVGYPSE